MMQGIAKEKRGGAEGASCENPAAGAEQVAAYIAGDLNEAARQEFVTHMADCRYCLEQVVLWQLAKVLAETEGDQHAAQTA